VAFAWVITDKATFGYLAEVFVLEGHRGVGLSKMLLGAVLAHPELLDVRKILLSTRDAHGLHAGFGLTPLANPGRLMEHIRQGGSAPP
jgi:GNAT superfamily N-acetyltransferase